MGRKGEEIAVSYLHSQNFEILERNFTTRWGEVNIIAKDGTDIVFIEVKTRLKNAFGEPSEAVDWRKRKRIIKTALFYLARHFHKESNYRFDVLTIEFNRNRQEQDIIISHYRNAFLME